MVKSEKYFVSERGCSRGSFFGMTLIEVLVALVVLVLVMAAVVPQIRAIQNSWASKRENTEVIQNSRVLVDHIVSSLSQAKKVTAVSAAAQTNGFIEFENNDGNTMRYEIDSGDNYVVFGPVGNLSELAGPVSQLQFACYDACDLDTPITDVNEIRTVKIQTTFINSAQLGRNQSFIGRAYLRTNSAVADSNTPEINEKTGSRFNFDTAVGQQHDLCQINTTRYLNVYSGAGDDGWSVILIVDVNNWTITKGPNFEFDTSYCQEPDVEGIDATHYLVTYTGPGSDGYAVILIVNTLTNTITRGTPFEFDTANCEWASLCRIDTDDFLCVYTGRAVGGRTYGSAVILTVNTVTNTVSRGAIFDFETVYNTEYTTAANIDNVHYLCAYRGTVGASCYGRAKVLTINTVTKTVTQASSYNFYPDNAFAKDLHTIDQNHFLLIFTAGGGRAMILTVNTGTWAIGNGAINTFYIDGPIGDPVIARQETSNIFIAAYQSGNHRGIFSVDTGTDTIDYLGFCSSPDRHMSPGLVTVDEDHFLETFDGPGPGDGWAVILEIRDAELILP